MGALDTVATSWLLVVCSMVVWSLLPVLWGWHPNLILTGSMTPRIAPGDVVLVSPFTSAQVQRGEIVLVPDPAAPSGRVLHRVDQVADDGSFTTKGDANPSADVIRHTPDDVLGQARLVIPAAGRLALIRGGGVQTPAQRMWILFTLAAVAVVVGTRIGGVASDE